MDFVLLSTCPCLRTFVRLFFTTCLAAAFLTHCTAVLSFVAGTAWYHAWAWHILLCCRRFPSVHLRGSRVCGRTAGTYYRHHSFYLLLPAPYVRTGYGPAILPTCHYRQFFAFCLSMYGCLFWPGRHLYLFPCSGVLFLFAAIVPSSFSALAAFLILL